MFIHFTKGANLAFANEFELPQLLYKFIGEKKYCF